MYGNREVPDYRIAKQDVDPSEFGIKSFPSPNLIIILTKNWRMSKRTRSPSPRSCILGQEEQILSA